MSDIVQFAVIQGEGARFSPKTHGVAIAIAMHDDVIPYDECLTEEDAERYLGSITSETLAYHHHLLGLRLFQKKNLAKQLYFYANEERISRRDFRDHDANPKKKLKQEHDKKISELKQEHGNRISELKEEHADKISELKQELSELKQKHANKISELKQEHADKISELKLHHLQAQIKEKDSRIADSKDATTVVANTVSSVADSTKQSSKAVMKALDKNDPALVGKPIPSLETTGTDDSTLTEDDPASANDAATTTDDAPKGPAPNPSTDASKNSASKSSTKMPKDSPLHLPSVFVKLFKIVWNIILCLLVAVGCAAFAFGVACHFYGYDYVVAWVWEQKSSAIVLRPSDALTCHNCANDDEDEELPIQMKFMNILGQGVKIAIHFVYDFFASKDD